MSPKNFKVATYSGVKVSQWKKSIIFLTGNVCLFIIILFSFISTSIYPFSPLLMKCSCITKIFSLYSYLFPILVIPFLLLTFFSFFSVVSVVSVAKKSILYINEMQPSVFLPVYFSYNHRTLYRTTSAETAHSFHFLYHLSKSIKALLCQPLCKTQTLSCKAKVMPIV